MVRKTKICNGGKQIKQQKNKRKERYTHTPPNS